MIEEIRADLEEHVERAIEALKREATKMRTGRAHPALLDGVRVEYYGSVMALNQIASVTVMDARLLVVKPWDRSQVNAIEKAILKSDVGLTPTNKGDVLLLPVPTLTGERRRELVKVLRGNAEQARVSIRQGRRDALDLLDTIDDISEDDLHRGRKVVQDVVDVGIKKVDDALEAKEKELTEV